MVMALRKNYMRGVLLQPKFINYFDRSVGYDQLSNANLLDSLNEGHTRDVQEENKARLKSRIK